MEDNDFIKYLTTVILTSLIAIFTALMYTELLYDISNPIFVKKFLLAGPNLYQFLPSIVSGTIVFIPIFLFIHLRIVYGVIKLRRLVQDKITDRGLVFILIATIGFIFSAIFACFFTIPNVENSPVALIILHSLRVLALLVGIIFGSFGWFMPKWIKEHLMRNKGSAKNKS